MATISYSLVTDKVRETKTTPQVEHVNDLGEKTSVLSGLESEKVKYQGIVDIYTTKISEIQTKIDAITALV